MHAGLARAAGGTLSGTNVDAVQRYVQEFPRASARWIYARDMSKWIRGVIYGDQAAGYYPFSLTYTGVISPAKGITQFFHACVNASMATFPELSRSNSRRHHTDKSFGVILIPCISASGLVHWHGFIRIPLLAIEVTQDDVLITIHDHGQKMLITGPAALRTMTQMLHDQFHPGRGVSTSLGISHRRQDAERHARAADHRRYPRAAIGWLRYLRGTADGEVRDWRETEFLPHAVFARLAE